MPAPRRRPTRCLAWGLALALGAALQAPAQAAPETIRIIRDRFGVPHVFAESVEAVSYGTGYALAQDRLWQMHLFRLIGKGRLSSLLGPLVVDIDKTVRFFTYTSEERAARFSTYPGVIRRGLRAFAAGVNAWIAEAQTDPAKMPFEFVEFGVPVIPEWTVDDSMALQDVLILSFGSGGGDELTNAVLLQDLVDQFGRRQGLRMFDDLVMTTDRDAPMTIPRGYRWRGTPTGGREREAEATRFLTEDARISLNRNFTRSTAVPGRSAAGTLEQLGLLPDLDAALEQFEVIRRGKEMLERVFHFGSNAQIVGPRRSETGNSLQTAGPQVGYLLPQWLADIGIHGGGFDATGMTFAGVGPAVLIGRGPGYAWTTTTGASDLTDTYVERLNPENPREYEWRGSFEPMDCRTEHYSLRAVSFDSQEICRTRHGPVIAFDEENGVAYSLRYAWFNREGGTVEGFFGYNQVESLADFATSANLLASNHNMFYVDDKGNYGYWHPGYHPIRARGIDLRLPQDGRGGSEWQGLLPLRQVPHAVNFPQSVLVNWNNQPSTGWERERAHPPLDNSVDLLDVVARGRVLPDPFGGTVNDDTGFDFDDLAANLRYVAMKHHQHTYFGSSLPAKNSLSEGIEQQALAVVQRWDGLKLDEDDDGTYDSAGKTILDRWVAILQDLVFRDDLGAGVDGGLLPGPLWHVLEGGDRERLRYDWLNGDTAREVATAAFGQAVAELREEYGSSNPREWRQEVALEHYQRLNADLFTDAVLGVAGLPNRDDSGIPGDVADHIEMDRGTYNHVVAYLDTPVRSGPLGLSRSQAGSVIPPGQCGFINLLGQECDHYDDQLGLYVGWGFKPMPLTAGAALRIAESIEVLNYPG